MPDLVINGNVLVDIAARRIYVKLTLNGRPQAGLNVSTLAGYSYFKSVLKDGTESPASSWTSWSASGNQAISDRGRGWYRYQFTADQFKAAKLMLDIDDGAGTTIDSSAVVIHFYGGTGTTGGLIYDPLT